MANLKQGQLRRFILEVAGTQHENRQKIIRVLSKGEDVVLWNSPVKGKDDAAIAITIGGKKKPIQVGWVPWVANKTVRQLKLKHAKIYSVGTDESGAWTKLQVEVWYESNKKSAQVDEHGIYIASVLDRMKYRSLSHARRIAYLPTREIQIAIDEWDTEGSLITKDRRKSRKSDVNPT